MKTGYYNLQGPSQFFAPKPKDTPIISHIAEICTADSDPTPYESAEMKSLIVTVRPLDEGEELPPMENEVMVTGVALTAAFEIPMEEVKPDFSAADYSINELFSWRLTPVRQFTPSQINPWTDGGNPALPHLSLAFTLLRELQVIDVAYWVSAFVPCAISGKRSVAILYRDTPSDMKIWQRYLRRIERLCTVRIVISGPGPSTVMECEQTSRLLCYPKIDPASEAERDYSQDNRPNFTHVLFAELSVAEALCLCVGDQEKMDVFRTLIKTSYEQQDDWPQLLCCHLRSRPASNHHRKPRRLTARGTYIMCDEVKREIQSLLQSRQS